MRRNSILLLGCGISVFGLWLAQNRLQECPLHGLEAKSVADVSGTTDRKGVVSMLVKSDSSEAVAARAETRLPTGRVAPEPEAGLSIGAVTRNPEVRLFAGTSYALQLEETEAALEAGASVVGESEAIPKEVPSTDVVAMESTCPSAGDDGSLSMNLVIVPFLRYGVNESATLEREKDYKLCLKKNLAHPLVQKIHLLTINSTDALIRFKEFTGNCKLVISEVASVDRARDPFEYISRNLVGRDVAFMNADIYLGEGFGKVDPAMMGKRNIMYSISRHVAPEHPTLCGKTSKRYYFRDLCVKYMGSHDMHMFRLDEPLPEEFLEQLEFGLTKYGIENRIIWLFKNVLKYCVVNPCNVLRIYHYHCSDLRPSHKMKSLVGRRLRSPPSNRLTCKHTS